MKEITYFFNEVRKDMFASKKFNDIWLALKMSYITTVFPDGGRFRNTADAKEIDQRDGMDREEDIACLLSIAIHISVCLSVCLSACLSVCLSVLSRIAVDGQGRWIVRHCFVFHSADPRRFPTQLDIFSKGCLDPAAFFSAVRLSISVSMLGGGAFLNKLAIFSSNSGLNKERLHQKF